MHPHYPEVLMSRAVAGLPVSEASGVPVGGGQGGDVAEGAGRTEQTSQS